MLLMIQLKNCAKMVVEPGGVHVLDMDWSAKSHGTCELGGGEWVCGQGCIHVLGVNGNGKEVLARGGEWVCGVGFVSFVRWA